MEIYKPKYIDEYTIRYDSMDEFYAIACTRLSEWEKNLVQWRNACNALLSLQSFQGQAANAAKNYLQEVHNTLMPAILQTFSLYKAQFLLYKTGYYAIDGHTYSVIPEEVLRGIMGKLGAEIWDTELLSDDVNSVIDSIADICPLTKPSIDGLQTELDNVRGDVRAYKDKIDNYEYTKYTQTNGELQGLIDALDNTIKSFLETGENLATYQAGTISQNTELINLSEQVYAAGQYMLDNQAEIDAAIEQQTSIYAEIQAEYDRIFEEECQLRQEEGAMQILDGAIQVGLAIAVTLGTGCTTLPATIAVGIAGGTMMVCGAGNLTQGSMNVYYGSIGDLTSVAVNPVCEVFFGGNEKNFDTFCYYNMMFLTMYMMAGAGSVSGMVVEAVQEGAGDIASTYVTSYLSSTCNLSNFESVLIGTTASFLIDPGLDAIGSHSLGSGTHFSHLNNYTNGTPNVNPHLHANQLDLDTNMHILSDATDIPPNTLINGNGVELPNHFYNDGVGVGSEGGLDAKIKPSNPYNVDAKPNGTVTKITDKMDEATRRSLIRENEAAETIAQNGYNIEQNPVIDGTTRNPDYLIEEEIFDCYSPAENTKVRNVASTIEEKVIKKGQAERVVLNLDDWKGNVDELVKQLNDYPIEGLKEVIIVYDGTVQSIYP